MRRQNMLELNKMLGNMSITVKKQKALSFYYLTGVLQVSSFILLMVSSQNIINTVGERFSQTYLFLYVYSPLIINGLVITQCLCFTKVYRLHSNYQARFILYYFILEVMKLPLVVFSFTNSVIYGLFLPTYGFLVVSVFVTNYSLRHIKDKEVSRKVRAFSDYFPKGIRFVIVLLLLFLHQTLFIYIFGSQIIFILSFQESFLNMNGLYSDWLIFLVLFRFGAIAGFYGILFSMILCIPMLVIHFHYTYSRLSEFLSRFLSSNTLY